MGENGACIVRLGPQGPDLPPPSPDLASLCRFLALACHGRTSRGAAPQPAKALHRAAWRGVPCERPGGHSPPVHLVSARQHAVSIVLWSTDQSPSTGPQPHCSASRAYMNMEGSKSI